MEKLCGRCNKQKKPEGLDPTLSSTLGWCNCGRPSDYTKELADKICSEITEGRSLKRICEDEEMPDKATVFRWLRTHEEFRDNYDTSIEQRTYADQESLEEMGDEAIIAANSVDPKSSSAVVAAYKLKADNKKWVMSKMKPKKYGDKVDVTSDGKAIKGNTIIFQDFKENE